MMSGILIADLAGRLENGVIGAALALGVGVIVVGFIGLRHVITKLLSKKDT